jgi:hypothetical protein
MKKERICLINRERKISDGKIKENKLMDGRRLKMLNSVENGLMEKSKEKSVMKEIESLKD